MTDYSKTVLLLWLTVLNDKLSALSNFVLQSLKLSTARTVYKSCLIWRQRNLSKHCLRRFLCLNIKVLPSHMAKSTSKTTTKTGPCRTFVLMYCHCVLAFYYSLPFYIIKSTSVAICLEILDLLELCLSCFVLSVKFILFFCCFFFVCFFIIWCLKSP